MMGNQAENLRKAIENLINVKLHDVLAKPGGLDRLAANRQTGVASYDVRMAEKKLDDALAKVLASGPSDSLENSMKNREPAFRH